MNEIPEGFVMETTGKGSDFLYLALYAFAGFAFELLLADVIEPLLGITLESMTTMQNIVHWIITSLVWGFFGYLLVRISKKKYGFDILDEKSKLKIWQYLLCALCILIMAYVQSLDWGGFRPLIEFEKQGTLKFVFQYIYYFFETFLFSLIIIFGQKAFEIWFKKKNVPYGGIVLGLTWGLGHILSKGSITIGLLTALSGFLFGAAYLIVGRDYRKTLPLLFIMFVI
jgi:hypothetical protein